MRQRAGIVPAMIAVSLGSVGCSSDSFDLGDGRDASEPVDGDGTLIDAVTDGTQETQSNDATPSIDAAPDAVVSGCPPKPPCSTTSCGPLFVGDLEGMSASAAPAFDATGFRCKTLTLCGAAMTCLYHDTANMLGSLQSQEATFYDGAESVPIATKLRLGVGAASPCGNPPVTFRDGDFVKIKFDGGKLACIFLPAFTGAELLLYVAADGSTFYDAALTKPAKRRP